MVLIEVEAQKGNSISDDDVNCYYILLLVHVCVYKMFVDLGMVIGSGTWVWVQPGLLSWACGPETQFK